MAKRKKSDELIKATKFSDLLLYEITGGNMGTKPVTPIKNSVATFGEKRGFLDSLIKLADMKRKDSVDDEGDSAFDIIRKNTQKKDKVNDGGKSWGTRDTGTSATAGPAESGADDPEPEPGEFTDEPDQDPDA